MLGLSGRSCRWCCATRWPIPTLGISAGAQLALVLATILSPTLLEGGRWPVAMAGAGAAAALVLAIGARRGFQPVTMVIAGMLVGLTASAVAGAVTLAQGQYLLSLVIWNGGSLVQQDWSGSPRWPGAGLGWLGRSDAGPSAAPAVPGAEGAQGLGLNVAAMRLAAVAVAVVLAAAVSAELGLIGFVGLAAPAMARSLGCGPSPACWPGRRSWAH
ncbi:iron chelate uptake ABC transporter family permease subunit (plasmid) [Paracoccus marcusii]|uniref:iron chelate uptake ABC transporter family permease subunit n=1 Tax=Paracoccus marcusii TaxID=59779 RepID=UPI002ED629D0|nr:iron chelate uptake ABC transporter family permease subunit [Paracoccus marcusii]